MAGIGRRWPQHHFGVAGQAQTAGFVAVIGQVDVPDFHVVLGGNGDAHLEGDALVVAAQFDHVGVEEQFMVGGGDGRGLQAG